MKIKADKLNFDRERQRFEVFLSKNDLSITQGRQMVFNEVFKYHGHFSAEDLVKVCRTRDVCVSRATIYRTLNELLESGVIRKTAFGEKHNNFEHVYDEKPHHHARCIRSGKVIELPDLGEENKYIPILEKMGFKVLGHELHFYGIAKESLDES